MTTYTKSGSFGWAGGGKSGAVVDLWATSRFAGMPAENQAPPGGSADAGPVTTGEDFGNPGGYFISGIATAQDYYVRVQYGGNTYWGACPEGTLGGAGGGASSPTVVATAFAYNTANILTGAPLYTPNAGEVIVDWWVEIDTAWNGLRPQLDLGTFSGPNGLLTELSASPIEMWNAATAATDNTGILLSTTPTSFSAALINAAMTNATTLGDWQFKMTAADPIAVVVSQDGTANTAVAATLTAANAPTLPTTFATGTNNQFNWLGTDPVGGGGGAPSEPFTISGNPTCTTVAQVITAMGGATGSVSGELFSTKCSLANVGGKIELTMLVTGAAANGNQIQAGGADCSVAMGFGAPSIFAGGLGGNPGATQGSAVLYLLIATPT